MGCCVGQLKNLKIVHPKNTIILYPGQFVKNLKQSIHSYYTFKNELGSGSYGRVVAAVNNSTSELRAIKIINKFAIKNEDARSKIMTEVSILKSLDHPNIIKIYEFHEDEFNLYLVMDLCTGGELLETISKSKCLNESIAADFMKQILSAVIYMHSEHVAHRDLKLENMLIDQQNSSQIKIIDFGTAVKVHPKKFLDYRIGTINYIAPEVISKKYNEKCDLWSCGVILYVLLSGKLPFSSRAKLETIGMIQEGIYVLDGGAWSVVSQSAKDLVRKLLEIDPKKRLTAVEAFKHPWIQSAPALELHQNILEIAANNLQSFHMTSKLQRAVIRFIASQLLTQAEKSELSSIFKYIDTEAIGKINISQIKVYWKKIFGRELTEEEAMDLMGRIDTDKSGYIDYSEFVVAAMDRKKLLSAEHLDAVFKAFDLEKNGKITASELKDVLSFESGIDLELFNKAIKEVDINGDGVLDYQEFRNMMASLVN